MTQSAESTQFVRKVDFPKVNGLPPEQRYLQRLLSHDSGATSCMVTYIRTPPGGASPSGHHVHDIDQIVYVLGGTMSFEIDGGRYEVESGSLVVIPSGVPHRNWNQGSEPTVHLAIDAPLPDPNKPLSRPVAG